MLEWGGVKESSDWEYTDGNFVTVVFKYNCDGVNLQLVNSNPTSTQQVPNKYWNLSEY